MVLKVDNLNCSRGRRQLIKNTSLELASGELLLISGANGSGKSTLLKVLGGLREPDSGSINWHGQSINSELFKTGFKWLSHTNGNQSTLTVYENLACYFQLTNNSAKTIDDVINRLGLAGHKNKLAGQLSAGLNRRLALARLIAGPSSVWLLDEPQTSLDKSGIAAFELMLTDFLNNGGMVLMTSHQPISIDEKYIQHLILH
jgi:heme exporter protein A